MKLAELLKPWYQEAVVDLEINGILQNDSRKIRVGDVFVAYPGAATDGRNYLEQAVIAGAVAIIYEPENWQKSIALPIPAYPVTDLVRQLGAIAHRFYQIKDTLYVTGVTGTNGKTTIAYQLAQAHELMHHKAAYIGTLGQGQAFSLETLNNTTPDALHLQYLFHQYQQEGIQQICMEVSSHALEQKRVDGISFKQAIFTNLTLDHLDYHHTMEAYAQAKAALFACPDLEYAIINQDDPYAKKMQASLSANCQLIRYGMQAEAEVRALSWQIDMTGTHIAVDSPWGKTELHITALGYFNIYNALAIFTSLMLQYHDIKQVSNVLSLVKPAPGRMEMVAQQPCIIVDYAHTPDALQNVLQTLAKVKENRIIAVFGCGGDRDKSKRPLMGKIATEFADIAIMTSDNPRTEDPVQIMEDIAKGIENTKNLYQIVNREEAIAKAIELAQKNDIIVIAGKGHESYQQIGHVKHPFSDQDVAKRLHLLVD